MSLPDELWRWILELGVECSYLSYKDLCCLSMSCRLLHRLSNEEVVWSKLLSSDFPAQPSSSIDKVSPKSLYQMKFEKNRAKKLLAERRAVLRIESQIHEHKRKVEGIKFQLAEENEKMKSAIVELKNLRRVREASIALKVWQPEMVHGRQKQIVEHYSVPVDFRINALEMEIRLCQQQISGFLKARKDEKSRHEATKERLSKVKYQPLQSVEGGLSSNSSSNVVVEPKKTQPSTTNNITYPLFNRFLFLKQSSM